MIKKKIIDTFRKNPDLRYLFIFDGTGQYSEELSEQHEEFYVKKIDQSLYFRLKIELEADKYDAQPWVLYHTFTRPLGEDFELYPLLGLYYANEELKLDDIAMFMEMYRLSEKHRPLIKRYHTYLNKTTQNKIIKILDDAELSETSLQRALISVALDLHNVSDKLGCLMQYLILAREPKKLERIHVRLAEMGLEDIFRSWLQDLFDYRMEYLSVSHLQRITEKLKYNILTQNTPTPASHDTYSRLQASSTVSLNRMASFFQEWLHHPRYAAQISQVFRDSAQAVDDAQIFKWYGLELDYGYVTEPLATMIIEKLAKDISSFDEDYFKRILLHDEISPDYRAVISFLQWVNLFKEAIAASQITLCETPDEFIRYYAEQDYQIDSYYRKAVLSYQDVNLLQQHLVQELFEQIHLDYDLFLIDQNIAWQNRMAAIKFDYHQLSAAKQFNFYRDQLRDFEFKGAVIISDAFRYELAQELAGMLLKDDKIIIEVQPYLASVPSNTLFGMSNLLPNKMIELDKSKNPLILKINGTTTGSQNRETILQADKPGARTVSFKELDRWNQAEGRAFFIEHRLAYIYHNQVDAPSEKKVLEHNTFNACDRAIQELHDLVKKLYNWNVYYIFITADHGFLYNHKELKDADKEDLPKGNFNYMDNTRFCIVDHVKKNESGHQFPLRNTTNIDTDLQVIIPKAVNRYRKQGNVSLKFDHGGASLQELVVPVVKLYKKDTKVRDQVTFRRVDHHHSISSSIKVSIIQNEPVSSDMKSRTIFIGLYGINNVLISNEETIVLDSTQVNATARSIHAILSLSAEGSRQSTCYLRAFDETDKNRMNPLYINDQITIQSLYEKDEF